MSKARSTVAALAGIALVAAIVIGLVLFFWKGEEPPAKPSGPFRDVADEVGITWQMAFLNGEQGDKYKINLYDHGSGLAIGDFDGDGRDDIYFVNQLGQNALYRNKGDGAFEDVAAKAGVAVGDRICVSATFVDYDNDGRQDLFVTSTRGGNILFHNKGDGTFADVTKAAGVHHIGHSQAGCFFDFDNDGFLDLLLLQTAGWTTNEYVAAEKYYVGKGTPPEGLGEIAASPKEFNILYRSEPDGQGGRKFVDVTEKSGLAGKGWAADAAFLDYNGDGRMDLLITNMFGPAQLYRNDGGGKFAEVAKETLGRTSAGGMGARAFGSRNNGRFDLYIVDMHSDMWAPSNFDLSRVDEKVKYHYMFIPDSQASVPAAMALEKKITGQLGLNYDDVLFGNTFFRNKGNGRFEEASAAANLETYWPWGIASGDFDNDGYEDLFIPSGMGYPWGYWPNRLMMNAGDGTFQERSQELGVEPPVHGKFLDREIRGKRMARSSRAAAVADFDGDGRLEIVVNNFNDQPYFFRSSLPTQNYLKVKLRGTKNNRDAIGAVVKLHVGDQVMIRQVNAATGYLCQSSKTLHFGLGSRAKIDKMEVIWPGGATRELPVPAINVQQEIVE